MPRSFAQLVAIATLWTLACSAPSGPRGVPTLDAGAFDDAPDDTADGSLGGPHADIAVSGDLKGTFNVLTQCSIGGGGTGMMAIVVTGHFADADRSLSFTEDSFAPGDTTYPGGAPSLQSDILSTKAPNSGSWQFSSQLGNGVVQITKAGGVLELNVNATYVATDARGPVHAEGAITCTLQILD